MPKIRFFTLSASNFYLLTIRATESFPRPRGKQKMRPLVSVIEAEGAESKGLNLEALLEPCRPLLLGDSMNTTKEAVNKNFDIS